MGNFNYTEQDFNELRALIESLNIRNGELTRQMSDVRAKNTELEVHNRALRELNASQAQEVRDISTTVKSYGTFLHLRSANIARNREWDRADAVTAFWRASEMAGEAGELGEALLVCLNVMIAVGKVNNTVKKLERERLGIRGSRTDLAALGRELADVIITTDLAAMHYEIDLWGWTRDTFNATSDKQGLTTKLE